MGVILLPDKPEYWNTRGLWPKHNPCSHMSCSRFKEIRENIHLSPVEQENASEEDYKGETGNGYGTSSKEVSPLDARWYAKAALLIHNFKRLSQHLCVWPGFAVPIDDTMKKFQGRLKNSWMKNKPVKQEYKLWAIYCEATGFCYKVLPPARVGNPNKEGC